MSKPYEWLRNLDEAEAEKQFSRGLLTTDEFVARFGRMPAAESTRPADEAEVAAIRAAM